MIYVGGAESMCDDIIQFNEMPENCRWEGAGGENGGVWSQRVTWVLGFPRPCQ